MLRHTRTYGLYSAIQKLLPMVWILPEAQLYDTGGNGRFPKNTLCFPFKTIPEAFK